MGDILLSKGEEAFIKNGIKLGMREDGRGWDDFRCVELELNVLPQCCGSARLKLANTDVMVGVKGEISEPDQKKPKHGKLNFYVDCSVIATPAFEVQGGRNLASRLQKGMESLYSKASSLDTTPLCIVEAKKCWCLYIDILILELGGNLFDAVSMAIKAALYNTRLPNITVVAGEHGENELELPEDPTDVFSLQVEQAPLLVTFSHYTPASEGGGSKKHPCNATMDATPEENKCLLPMLISGVLTDGRVIFYTVPRKGIFNPNRKVPSIKMVSTIGKMLNQKLLQALKQDSP